MGRYDSCLNAALRVICKTTVRNIADGLDPRCRLDLEALSRIHHLHEWKTAKAALYGAWQHRPWPRTHRPLVTVPLLPEVC